jgi:YVTN family beta-propeller protein
MTAAAFRLGVDFGTSNTVAALVGPDGQVQQLLFDGLPLLPSAVFAGSGTGLLCGWDAIRAAFNGDPSGLELHPRRRIDEHAVRLGEHEYPVAELIATVLGRVAMEAARVAGRGVDLQVVLTFPASWTRARLDVLADAAARAGLGTVQFVPEPVAAAAYFAAVVNRDLSPDHYVVVYDLGAGTFDVSVVRAVADGFAIVASDELANVGGIDLDAVVVRHARQMIVGADQVWQRLDWPQTLAEYQARQTLWQAARAAKEQLSWQESADLYVPIAERIFPVTRDEFEIAARPYLERPTALTVHLLTQARVPPEEIGGVFLVGGSSRIPMAATLLHRALHIAPTMVDQPELVVAEGALYTSSAALAPDLDGAADRPAVRPSEGAQLVTAAFRTAPAAPAAAAASPPARARRWRLVIAAAVALIVLAGGGVAFGAVLRSRPETTAGLPPVLSSPSPLTSPSASAEATPPVLVSADRPVMRASIGVDAEPQGVAVSPDSRTVYVANQHSHILSVIDVASRKVSSVWLAHRPRFVAVSSDGAKIFASMYEDDFSGSGVAIVDAATKAVRYVSTGPQPYALSFAPDGNLWVPIHNQHRIEVYDPDTGARITMVEVPPNAHSVTFSPTLRRAFTPNHESNLVSAIDMHTNKLTGIPVATAPHSLALSPDQRTIIVACYGANVVDFIDPVNLRNTGRLAVGVKPRYVAFSADGSHAYIVNEGSDSVSVIDVATRTVSSVIPVGHSPRTIGVAPDGRFAYVSNGRDNAVSVLDVAR